MFKRPLVTKFGKHCDFRTAGIDMRFTCDIGEKSGKHTMYAAGQSASSHTHVIVAKPEGDRGTSI